MNWKYYRKKTDITKVLFVIAQEWNMLVSFLFHFGFYSIRPSFCLSHKCLRWSLFELTVTHRKQITRTPKNTTIHLFSAMCVWISGFHTTHFPFLQPCLPAGAYTLAHARGRCSFAGENKMKPDTLVVSRDWMGCVEKMLASPRVVKISV